MKPILIVVILLFISGCEKFPHQQKNINFPDKFSITQEDSVSRFKVVSVQLPNPLSKDLLIDTTTGESWYLQYNEGGLVEGYNYTLRPYLYWKKFEDMDSEFQLFRNYVKVTKEKKKTFDPDKYLLENSPESKPETR